jgi:hypothetical protein
VTLRGFPYAFQTLQAGSRPSRARCSDPEFEIHIVNPKRYKGAYGGRGSAKSHFFAEQLIRRCSRARLGAVCIREVPAGRAIGAKNEDLKAYR